MNELNHTKSYYMWYQRGLNLKARSAESELLSPVDVVHVMLQASGFYIMNTNLTVTSEQYHLLN